jgi:DivIVA domain-containing protein
MPLTPDEIADKEFSFGLRGYDQTEVREFLSLVASEVAGGIVIAANLGDGTQTPGTGVQGDQGAEVVGGDAAAQAVLAAAEAAALRLVAEAQARIDQRLSALPSGGVGGGDQIAIEAGGPSPTVDAISAEISALVAAREDILHQLQLVRSRVISAVEAAEADVALRPVAPSR